MIQMAGLMIEGGADFNIMDEFNQSPLSIALLFNHLDMVKLLIKGVLSLILST